MHKVMMNADSSQTAERYCIVSYHSAKRTLFVLVDTLDNQGNLLATFIRQNVVWEDRHM